MVKSTFASFALLAACARATSDGVVDFASICGLVAPSDSMVDFAFADGSKVLKDGDIATASLSLHHDYYDNPPTSVSIDAPGVQCGRSTFLFDKNDPSTFDQSVTCRTDGGASTPAKDGSLVDIAMVFDIETMSLDAALQETIHKVCLKMLLQRELGASGSGGGTGDPHLTTFDRVNYDFQKPGVFRLFESRNLQVQIFQEKCTPVAFRGERAPSCYQGAAVAFAGSVAKFFVQNGKIQLGKGTSSLDWLSIAKLKGKTDGYRVFATADQASYVDVTLGTWINSYPYLNIAVKMSPFFKDPSVRGLLGNWNGNPSDDLRDNNQLETLHGVGLEDNLFTCVGDSCAKFLQPASLKDDIAHALSSNMTMLHQSYMNIDATTIPLRAFHPALVPFAKKRTLRGMGDDSSSAGVVHAAGSSNDTVTFPPTAEAKSPPLVDVDVTKRAVELCSQVVGQIATCDKYVSNRVFYVETVCIGDAVLLNDLSVVDGTKINYLRECRREIDSRIDANLAGAEEMHTMLADRLALGFGDLSTCDNNCSGRGTCLAAGCKCENGYTGIACDLAI